MALSWSHELCAVFDEAERDAIASRETLSTAHLLQAFVTVACEAEPFMTEQRLDEAAIYAVRRHVPPERVGTLQRVLSSAERMAERAGAASLSSLHVLNAFCRQSNCEAYELLELLRFDVDQVRAVTTSMVVERGGRRSNRDRHASRHSIMIDPDRQTPPPEEPASRHHSPLPISFHPALMGRGDGEPAADGGPVASAASSTGGAGGRAAHDGFAGGAAAVQYAFADEPGDDPDDFLEEVWPMDPRGGVMRTPSEGVMRLELEDMEYGSEAGFDAEVPDYSYGQPFDRKTPDFPPAEPTDDPSGRMSIFTPPPPTPFPKVRASTQRKRSRWGRSDIKARGRQHDGSSSSSGTTSSGTSRGRKKRSLGLIRPGRKESEDRKKATPEAKGPITPNPSDVGSGLLKSRGKNTPQVPHIPSKSTGKRKSRLTARESQEKTAESLADRLFTDRSRDLRPKSVIEEERRREEAEAAEKAAAAAARKRAEDEARTNNPQPMPGSQRAAFYRGKDKRAVPRKPVRPQKQSKHPGSDSAAQTAKPPRKSSKKNIFREPKRAVAEAAQPQAAPGPSGRSPIIRTPQALAERYRLPARVFPTLNKYGINLLMRAVEGGIDEVIGREREIDQLTDILNKRRSNNPILIGPAGVGKTAIVEGLALKMVQDAPPPGLEDRRLIALDLGTLLCGTHLRGSFQERLINIKAEVRKAGGKIILFLDEVHTWLGNGKGEGTAEAAGELKTALARGELPCIGATTIDEFKRFVEADPAFERRFDVIEVKPPSPDEAIRIIGGIIENYEEHHQIGYSREAVESAVQLSDRFIRERQLPDKAISVLDRAGAVARRLGAEKVGRAEVAAVISDLAAVPCERLLMADRDRFLHMEETLSAQLIGHQHVINRLARVIRRNYAGFSSERPIGSFLFLGPTGVGKTELVKVLADFLFGSRNAVVRLDMSEYMEQHAVARLIGAPPGYVGFEDGGQLTEALRRKPYQVVLLDEVEKAHPEILNLFLQLLDEGRLTDGRGRTVDFRNAVIIMTSNLGAEHFAKRSSGAGIGFAQSSASPRNASAATRKIEEDVVDTARKAFPIELWNRIEERLVFRSLSEGEVARIASLQLRESSRRLENERNVRITYAPSLIPFLIENGGFDPQLGARPMRQTIQRFVEDAVAEALLLEKVAPGDIAHVIAEEGAIVIQRRSDDHDDASSEG